MNEDKSRAPPRPSHLFTVRLWAVELGNGQTEWRGQVQHVLSGEIHYFRDWPTLVLLLQTTLSPTEALPRDEDR